MAKCVMLKSGGITDVTVGGASVVADGVAKIPNAGPNIRGTAKYEAGSAPIIGENSQGLLALFTQNDPSGRNGRYANRPFSCKYIDAYVKAAMTDDEGAVWTDTERQAALARMGCTVDDDGTVKFTAQET